jgi:hypothetical protein
LMHSGVFSIPVASCGFVALFESTYLCGLCVSPLGIAYLAVAVMTSSYE